ncbi:L-dopachrome tautomerase-related protein [Chitinophaga sp. S165]|uniref:L-dopachrome tautomerase-related protein n=1 Tax=Chitinophaga sp. S165 TaxID=2135462 RepID=UPI000D7134DE|nr:L-dopachrome tautomerase-related protein [Chitinophaga sp. S165]PWV56554.1 sugar lactone lactonase YvrE [Chitinophaga sp. S165]
MRKQTITIMIAAGLFFAACANNSKQEKATNNDTTAEVSRVDSSGLEVVFADSTYQLTGVAVTADGRVFANYPYWLDKHSYSVVEVKNGKPVPYPDETWNSFKKGEDGQNKFVCVQAVVADDKGFLWIVDAAGIGLGKVYGKSNKLVKIKLAANKIERIYRFPESVAGEDSYINDIRIDNTTGYAYMTSSSNGGIVVVNINTGDSRMVLHGTPSVLSDTAYHFTQNGKELAGADGHAVKVNSDGIALSPDKAWLYYKPLTDDKLYRISTRLLQDFKTAEKVIADSVQDLGHFITTDGMEFDKAGNLYLGDLEHYSIVKITPDLKMQTLVTDTNRLVWPDSYSISDDGYLYISTSQIQQMPWFNNNQNLTKYPYYIYRLKI